MHDIHAWHKTLYFFTCLLDMGKFILTFFFIFKSSSALEISIGISLLLLFFLSYRFSFKSQSGLVYMWLSFEMFINIMMSLLFGFVYFALFTAFFIGNIKNTTGFFIMY